MNPEPVCFWFAHTADTIQHDLDEHTVSSIYASVKAAVADGECACQTLNPTGLCCLPAIHRLYAGLRSCLPPR